MRLRLRDPSVAQRLAVGILLGAIALLVLEVRFEHHVVLAMKPQAWVPLVYGTSMLVLGAIALPLWLRGGRQAMAWGFACGAIVGIVGFWFHAKGNPGAAIAELLRVVARSPGGIVIDGGAPPILAPLAWSGLGLLGIVVCLPVHVDQPPAASRGEPNGTR